VAVVKGYRAMSLTVSRELSMRLMFTVHWTQATRGYSNIQVLVQSPSEAGAVAWDV